ncbi:MAG: sensor histidine kinase RegB [Paracoccaceae bacterium]
MSDSSIGLVFGHQASNWIRLRTLILLRWVAVGGQVAAITVAREYFSLSLEIGLCYLAIGISAMVNLVATFVFPENRRLTESENFLLSLFDLLQLSFLLYLTGGLNNPFAMLLLGPVVISATVMSLRLALLIGTSAVVSVTLLALYHMPLRTEQGFILEIPQIFLFGHWAALVIAVAFMSLYAVRVTTEIRSMAQALTATQMALSREQKLTDLGGVVAAAAHELGTPLATITLTSSELVEELDKQPELQEDARLIREQADRCRDILRGMGRAGKDDLLLRQAPLTAVVEEAAEPHFNRGKDIRIFLGQENADQAVQPNILRLPEVIHGIRNLIQNAVDFAADSVWVELDWTDQAILIRIMDDGPGFPPQLIGRIGDPFVRRRRAETPRQDRPGYEGMGLGLFIAKTLLERTNAELGFANGTDRGVASDSGSAPHGAIVTVTWPRTELDAAYRLNPGSLGVNQPFRA